MADQQRSSQILSDTSAAYRIRIKGYLDSSWSDQLGGVTIEHTFEEENASITLLTGEFTDQAALLGVLNSLYSLGFSLLSVTCQPTTR